MPQVFSYEADRLAEVADRPILTEVFHECCNKFEANRVEDGKLKRTPRKVFHKFDLGEYCA